MIDEAEIEAVVEGLRRTLRVRGYSPRTEQAYLGATRRFLRYWSGRGVPPDELRSEHLETFLRHLAENARLAPNSRNLVASGISFFFQNHLGSDEASGVVRAKKGDHVPVVFSHSEAMAVIEELRGKYRTIGSLLYGTGMRISECLALRVKDLDFDLSQITVRGGKGGYDRHTVLPRSLTSEVEHWIKERQRLHRTDRSRGGGWASLPGAYHAKSPRAGYDIRWQFIFPSRRETTDPATGRRGRWHLHVSAAQRTIKRAIQDAGVTKPASTHTFRHTFATETLRSGYDVRTVQKLMGHKDIRITMRYLHAIEQTGLAVRSPIDREPR